MKNMTLLVCLTALGMMFAVATHRPLKAQTSPAVSAGVSAPSAAEADATKSFAGKISVMDGKYVLVSGSDTFQLDDQDRARAFEGKNVNVTGTLDAATNTIHVADIKAA